ncbi:ATP-binding protein [Pirellulales bacterium]|nr:ATP-binding protein [Pirellulales bacterium]
MSYRTFKQALGETSLERKCRLLFGTCLLVLITGSFWWFARENDKIVYGMNRFVGKPLVHSAMIEAHQNVFVTDPYERETNESLIDTIRSQEFKWQVLHPENPRNIGAPADSFEYGLMTKWTKVGETLDSDDAIDAAFRDRGDELSSDRPGENDARYKYYQPVFAKQGCITCHNAPLADNLPHWPGLQVGDLLAIVRVEMDTEAIKKQQSKILSLLMLLGVVTVFLSMAALYVIIRYVIVKPLEHLRDVSNAIRRGEVEKRAMINSGDEFEELGASFNRMLRQLLRQQDELREINQELDGKIDELAQANLRLFEMNQHKSDFLATVSHELRTPLNSIIGFSDLLRALEQLDDKQRRYAENIQQSGKTLLVMINDILNLAKIESGRMELRISEFDIGTVVLTQCDMARPLSEKKRIELNCEIAPGLTQIRQDQGKIEQVLNNLLSNAIKFTPDGGRIHVSASRDELGDLRLVVTDTGIGISESEQSPVFEKFRQGTTVLPDGNAMTREYSGTGLGLSIVRELCRLMGGDVVLESEVGAGSEFTVVLPWSIEPQTRIESPLAEELRQLAKA